MQVKDSIWEIVVTSVGVFVGLNWIKIAKLLLELGRCPVSGEGLTECSLSSLYNIVG